MYRLRRLRLENIGHTDARFRTNLLDFTGNPQDGDGTSGIAVDTITWLRNGGGKSSLFALFYSLMLPAKVDFIGHAKGKSLADYVAGGAVAHVIAEWEDDTELWAGPALITGGVYQWRDGHRPHDPDTAWEKLQRGWYMFRPMPGILDLETLPITNDLGRLSRESYLKELVAAMERNHRLELVIAKDQTQWDSTLTNAGLDPRVFKIQRDMNQDEGAITALFNFATPEKFVDFLIDLVVDTKQPTDVRNNLQAQARTIAQRPARELEQRFLAQAILRLKPVRDAAREVTARTRERARIALATERARQRIRDAAAACDTDAAVAEGQATEATAKATAEYRKRGQSVRRVAALEQLACRLAVAEATATYGAAQSRQLELQRAERAWQAVGSLLEEDGYRQQRETLDDLIAQQGEKEAPLRAVHRRTAAALAAKLDLMRASAHDEAEAADTEAVNIDEQAVDADTKMRAALSAAAGARSSASQARTTLEALAKDERQARADGLLRPGESSEQAVARHELEQADVTKQRDRARGRLGEIVVDLNDVAEREKARAVTRHEKQEAYNAVWDAISQRRAERDDLSHDPRLIELAALDAEIGVDLDAAGSRLVDLLGEQVERAEAALVAEEVSAADDRRAQLALVQTSYLPAPLDVEQAVEVLEHAGIQAVTGLQFLRDTVPASRHTSVIAAFPQLIGGIVVIGDPPETGLEEILRRTGMTMSSLIQVSTNAAAHQLVMRELAPTSADQVVIPLNRGLLDRTAADAEAVRIQEKLGGLDRRRQQITHRREADRTLASRLREHLNAFNAAKRQDLDQRLEALERELERIDADAEKDADRKTELAAERVALTETEQQSTDRLAELSGILVVLCDLAARLATVAELEETATTAEAEAVRQDGLAGVHGDRAREARDHAGKLRRTAALRRAERDRYDGERGKLEAPRELVNELSSTVHVTPLDTLRTHYERADRDLAAAIGDSALEATKQSVNQQLTRVAEQLKEFSEKELELARHYATHSDAAEPERRRAALTRARDLRQTSDGELAAAKIELDAARNAEKEVTSRPRSREDDAADDGDVGPLDYPDAAAARVALAVAKDAVDAARSAANAYEKKRDERLGDAKEAHGDAERLRASDRVLDAAMAGLPADDTVVEDLDEPDDLLEREFGLSHDASISSFVAEAARLESDLQAAVKRCGDDYTAARNRLARDARSLASFAQDLVYAPVVDRRLIDRLSDDPEALRRTLDELIADVTLREKAVAAALDAIERDQLLLVQQCVTLTKSMFDDLDQVSRNSVLPAGLGAWSRQRFLSLELGRWGTDEELARRLSSEIDRMVALVTPDASAKASALPDPMTMAKRFVLAALGGPGNVVAKVLKPKPTLVVERVSVTAIQKFSGGELLTVSVMLYCTLARLRAANRGRRLPGGVGTLLLDNPFSKATYVLFLRLQRQVAAAQGVQLIYATAVRDLTAIGRFPLILRLRNGVDERTRRQYVEVVERFGDAVREGVTRAREEGITNTRLHREPAEPADGPDAGEERT